MRLRIVIADDHPVFLIGLRALLKSAFDNHYVVSGEATNVDQLLSSLEKELPNVLITDFNMPGVEKSDGLRLIETVRRNYPSLSVIVVTSLSNAGLINSVLNKGVYAVINKQSLATELTYCLRNLLQGRRYTMRTDLQTSHAKDISPRELEVIRLLAQGKSINDIANMLNRTKQTISSQKKSAMNKIGVKSTAELFEYIRDMGL
ncbi:response regulator transcription factor [Enterobacter cloacae]|uniref:response regulator transcription factor n=1 Tax=Enterobacter cloacae TaxID=550 RepID=UPI002FF7299F